MRKILILAAMLTLGNATDMCSYYLDGANKNADKAAHSRSIEMKKTYVELAINHLIDAKYNCPATLEDRLIIRIDRLEDNLQELEG